MGLERRDGAAWLAQNHSGSGLFGSIATLVKVRSGYEAALAAVLGSAADALAAENAGAARAALDALKSGDGGRAAIVLGTGRCSRPRSSPPCPPERSGRST